MTEPIRRQSGSLLAVLGIAFGLSLTVGNTIGSGILRTPGEVARLLPSPALFIAVWILGAAYAGLGANSLTELATMMPETGGYTVYLRRAMGLYAGFVIGWTDWLSTCSSAALSALVIGEYTAELLKAPPGWGAAISTAVILVFALLQWRGIREGSMAQNITALFKALAFAVLIAFCFLLGRGFSIGPSTTVPGGIPLMIAFVVAMQSVIFTYDGYNGIIYFSGEVRNPDRDIPRSIFGGVLAVAAIYLLVNVGFLYVLPLERMAGEPLVAATAANAVFGPRGDTVIRVLTIVSLLSALNAYQLMTPRVLYRLSTFGFLRGATYVNRGGTPAIGLLLSTVVILALVLTGTVQIVLAVTAFFFVLQYALVFLTVFILRKREPEARRPFRARGHPWTTGLVLIFSIAFLIADVFADTMNTVYSLILLALSWPVYRYVRPRTPPVVNA
ncbi:MAG TPA: APC family permease [Gemmatimonadaceae bacterium]|jgi:APA family basic amino acid/polyamine antiporter